MRKRGRGWNVTSASVRGSGHEKTGLPCQDFHKWTIASDDILVAAVADGAGSAPLAEVGSALAAEWAAEHLRARLVKLNTDEADDFYWHTLLTECARATRADLEERAQILSVPLTHLATTLILVAASHDFVAGIQIGDGGIVVAESEENMVCVGRPGQSEYLNETHFLTSTISLELVAPIVWRHSPSHLAIFTDGLQMAALRMPEAHPHPGFFAPLFRFLKSQTDFAAADGELVSFLQSPRLRERTDDDVTLLLADFVS